MWIVSGKLNFEKLINNRDQYVKGWHLIVENWMLEPASQMAGSGSRVTDRGIAMLLLLLSFFEPLGTILNGSAVVIPPFLTGCIRRIHAAIFSFIAGVIPPMPMFGRSLL